MFRNKSKHEHPGFLLNMCLLPGYPFQVPWQQMPNVEAWGADGAPEPCLELFGGAQSF